MKLGTRRFFIIIHHQCLKKNHKNKNKHTFLLAFRLLWYFFARDFTSFSNCQIELVCLLTSQFQQERNENFFENSLSVSWKKYFERKIGIFFFLFLCHKKNMFFDSAISWFLRPVEVEEWLRFGTHYSGEGGAGERERENRLRNESTCFKNIVSQSMESRKNVQNKFLRNDWKEKMYEGWFKWGRNNCIRIRTKRVNAIFENKTQNKENYKKGTKTATVWRCITTPEDPRQGIGKRLAHDGNWWCLPPLLPHSPTSSSRLVFGSNGDLRILGADLTTADAWAQIARFESLALRSVELCLFLDSGQPEAQFVGKVMTRSAGAVTFDEWCGTEVFQTGSGTWQRLTATFSSGSRVLFLIE